MAAAAAAADTDTEVGTPYVNVLRYSALGVFASCYAKHLFDQTRFPELAKLTGLLRDCADSSVLRTLAAGLFAGGQHTVRWNGTDDAGRSLAAGVYLARLQTGSGAVATRVCLVR